jgi:cell division protein FtsQ
VPVTAPTDRRFLRAQVKPGRRPAPWRRWIIVARVGVAAGLIAAMAWWCAVAIVRAPALRIEHVTVGGTQHLSGGEVLALLDGLRGRNILFVDLEAWRQKVLASPWVADVTLRRSLPGSVEVHVTERHPIAISRVGGEFFLIDEHGGVIDEYGPRYADFDLPILDGLAPGEGPGSAVNERRVNLAARLLSDVRARPDLAKRISQVDVSDPRDAVVIVDQDTARVRLGEDRFAERLQSYLEMAPSLREHVPAIDYVDLRFGERWIIGAQASTVPTATVAAAPRRAGTTNQ